MSEIRVKYVDAKTAIPAPCEDPFTNNRYRDEATGDLVLPDGFTPEVVNYYLKEHPTKAVSALVWLASARLAGRLDRLCPELKLSQVKAWMINPPV